MKRTMTIIISVLALLSQASAHSAHPVSSGDIFSLGNVKIGTTTIDDLQRELGASPSFRSGNQDEAPLQICYVAGNEDARTYTLFESGSMGGFSRITGFSISAQPPAHECSSTQKQTQNLSPGNGVKIGQSRAEFMSKFAVKFSVHGNELSYKSKFKRAATAEEIQSLEKMWPNEKSYQLDVVVSINAHFEGGHLTKYEVSRTESY